MGVLAPGSAYSRPSAQPPIDTSGIFWAHMSGRGGQTNLKISPINFLAISGDSKHFCFFQQQKLKLARVGWGGWSPKLC